MGEDWSEFDPVYDLPVTRQPSKTYLIATTQRTGSHYLASLLAEVSTVGVPFEYLNGYRMWLEFQSRSWPSDESSAVRLLREMQHRRTGSTGWFGLKSHWHTWQEAQAMPHLAGLIRPERFVLLMREDTIAQAASLALAERTGVWVDTGRSAAQAPRYSRAHVESARVRLEQESAQWQRFLAGEDVLRLTYEDLIDDPRGAVAMVLQHLGVAEVPQAYRALPRMLPRRDGTVEQWAQRYREGK